MIFEQKLQLRTEMLDTRSRLDEESQRNASQQLLILFKEQISLKPTDIIAGYYPIRQEMNVSGIMEYARESGCKIALPVIQKWGEALIFRQWNRQLEELEKDPVFGILQPKSDNPLLVPTILLVPLLACDKLGNRLGYSGGFYDRTIRQLREVSKTCQIIGCAYDFQYVEKVPVESHDEKLDQLITDKESILF